MQSGRTSERGAIQISGTDPQTRRKVLESNLISAIWPIASERDVEQHSNAMMNATEDVPHLPSMITPVKVESSSCLAPIVIAKEPHVVSEPL